MIHEIVGQKNLHNMQWGLLLFVCSYTCSGFVWKSYFFLLLSCLVLHLLKSQKNIVLYFACVFAQSREEKNSVLLHHVRHQLHGCHQFEREVSLLCQHHGTPGQRRPNVTAAVWVSQSWKWVFVVFLFSSRLHLQHFHDSSITFLSVLFSQWSCLRWLWTVPGRTRKMLHVWKWAGVTSMNPFCLSRKLKKDAWAHRLRSRLRGRSAIPKH